MEQGEIRLGVIGCGGFGLYALQQFAQVPGVKLAGHGRHAPRGGCTPRRGGSGSPTSRMSASCWRATTSTWSTSPRRRSCTIRRRWRPCGPASM